MVKILKLSAKQVRKHFGELMDGAEAGRPGLITLRERVAAVILPVASSSPTVAAAVAEVLASTARKVAAKEAHDHFGSLLTAAKAGRATLITRRDRSRHDHLLAVLAPLRSSGALTAAVAEVLSAAGEPLPSGPTAALKLTAKYVHKHLGEVIDQVEVGSPALITFRGQVAAVILPAASSSATVAAAVAEVLASTARKVVTKEARERFGGLLTEVMAGRASVITRQDRPVAVFAPLRSESSGLTAAVAEVLSAAGEAPPSGPAAEPTTARETRKKVPAPTDPESLRAYRRQMIAEAVAKLKKRKKRQSAQVEDVLVLVRDDDDGEVDVAEVLRDLNE
jgi:antitoxin (DNA-binding transcriptional repressor) of toxin-antitoxin stability system